MHIFAHRFVICLSLLAASWVQLHAQAQSKKQPLEGIWLGNVKDLGAEVRVAFQVALKDGKLTVTMDIIERNFKGFEVEEVTLKDGIARFAVTADGPVFEGKLNEGATEIVGQWKRDTVSLPLTLKRVDKLPSLARPQEPKRPFPYREEDVAYENKKAGVKVVGTLTLPEGKGPFPAVLLIAGAGAMDRNGESNALAGHRPLLLIADNLTRRGIAVLRVDKRGVGASTGDGEASTTAEFAEDALVGVASLKARKEIDGGRIGLIGHSEGGVVAALAASQSRDVSFVVLLAANGLPGEEVIVRSHRQILEGATPDKAVVDMQVKLLNLIIRGVKEQENPEKAKERIVEEFAQWKSRAGDAEKKLLTPMEGAPLTLLIGQLNTPWARYFLRCDPRSALRKVTCPVLALNGAKDLQVSCTVNLETIAKALKENGKKDVTVKELPNLNHFFQTCKTGSPAEYGTIDETMAPIVLETMADWILARVKK